MYKDKSFHVRPISDVMEDFKEARSMYTYIDRIFIADGDALIYKTEDLLTILDYIKQYIPECKRVTSYATPRSLLLKSQEELDLLHERGLEMLYLGLESGCDEILTYMNKGATAAEITLAGQKAKKAGFSLSITILSGLGGTEKWKEHAVETGKVLSAIRPDFIGEMTLNIIPGTVLHKKVQSGEFKTLSPEEILEETKVLIENIDAPGCVFRSNHVSNYVNIRGTFNEGKADMIAQLDAALERGHFKERHYTNM
jgi:radical SAM superfamily enzyme YgiQ (UPF0313 family)